MANKLTYKSTKEEIGDSLAYTLDEIQKQGETKLLKFEMLYKYGRFLLINGDSSKAYDTFQQCSIHSIDNGLPESKELYYWTSRSLEEQGKKDLALKTYLMLLERDRFTNNDDEFVNAILDRLISFGDISTFVNEYKNRKKEDEKNPKDFLGQVIKLLKENR